ncbi:VOC family protein [Rhodococcus sp. NPDC056743]|uniref:VOC family protein n=1 Tax=Rhodococcus sp. NPDC056743 TaxID=3345934 RepID=UPI00366C3C68
MKAADQYHVAIVTDDPEAKMLELSELFGYTWGDMMGGPTTVTVPSGDSTVDTTVDLKAWYSLSEPRIEIVQSVPGSVWTPTEGSGIHHLGYWVDDVSAASAELTRRGYAVEAVGNWPDGTAYWAYHCSSSGPRIEIVSRNLKPVLDRYFETGKLSS